MPYFTYQPTDESYIWAAYNDIYYDVQAVSANIAYIEGFFSFYTPTGLKNIKLIPTKSLSPGAFRFIINEVAQDMFADTEYGFMPLGNNAVIANNACEIFVNATFSEYIYAPDGSIEAANILLDAGTISVINMAVQHKEWSQFKLSEIINKRFLTDKPNYSPICETDTEFLSLLRTPQSGVGIAIEARDSSGNGLGVFAYTLPGFTVFSTLRFSPQNMALPDGTTSLAVIVAGYEEQVYVLKKCCQSKFRAYFQNSYCGIDGVSFQKMEKKASSRSSRWQKRKPVPTNNTLAIGRARFNVEQDIQYGLTLESNNKAYLEWVREVLASIHAARECENSNGDIVLIAAIVDDQSITIDSSNKDFQRLRLNISDANQYNTRRN